MGGDDSAVWTGESVGETERVERRIPVSRRRVMQGLLALGVPVSLGGSAGATGTPDVDVAFRDAVTVEITGDLDSLTGTHHEAWNDVRHVFDHVRLTDLSPAWSGAILPNGLRVVRYDPDEGALVIALNSTDYNHLYTADVYTSREPDPFGNDADVSAVNPYEGAVALDDLSVPRGSFADGETVEATATLENVDVEDRRQQVFVGFSVIGPDGSVYTNDGTTGHRLTLGAGERESTTVTWDVESDAPDGLYDAHVAVWRETDRDALQTKHDEYVLRPAFMVADEERAVRISAASVVRGTYTPGEEVAASLVHRNVTDTDERVLVGFSALGPDGTAYTNDGTTGRSIRLPGESETETTVTWTVEPDAPAGLYDAHLAIWRESDGEAPQTKYDERFLRGTFEVVSGGDGVGAAIEALDVSGGTYGTGDVVRTDVTVRNTGDREHTVFVGYSAIDPDGTAHTNDGTTGRPVTLAAGERREVTVEWTVEPDAPPGEYEVHVVVWEERNPDQLETALDERRAPGAFEVE